MKIPEGYCQCGCGQETKLSSGGKLNRFMHGHSTRCERARGPANGNYKGGLWFDTAKKRWYINCIDGSVFAYYRAVMEAHIKRPLGVKEVVHHINGDTTDDSIENLELMTKNNHARLHTPDNLGKRNYKTPIKYSNNDLTKAIIGCKDAIGKIPTVKDYVKHVKNPCERAIRNRFGGWRKALKAAGF